VSTLPLAARRVLFPLTAVLAAACRDATAPDRPAVAAPASISTAPAVTSRDPVPPLSQLRFLALVAKRFDGTARETEANRWAATTYPPLTTAPSCAAARQLAALTLQYFQAGALRGQAGNPPVERDLTTVPTDAANIVNTALAVACRETVPSELFTALLGDGAAAYLSAATGGTLKTRDAHAAAVIPAGALPSDALVMIVPLGGYRLPTTLPQGGPYFRFETVPAFARFNRAVRVEITQTGTSSVLGDNTILAHVPTGSSVILPLPSTACSALGIGTFPAWSASVRPSLSLAGDGTLGGDPTAAVIGTPIRCATVESWSPFGIIQVVSSSFNRSLLDLQACGTSATGRRFRALNKSGQEVVVFYAGTTNGTTYGKKLPIRLAPGSATTPARAVFELPLGTIAARLYYGPLTQKTVSATSGAPTC
jgi:hypothetical protein